MFIFLCSFCIRILPPISASHQIRWLQFSGHCWRSKNETSSQLLLWEPKHGRHSKGAPTNNKQRLLTNLESDTSLSRQDLAPVMANRQEWDRFIKSVRVHPKQIDRQMQLPFCLQFMFHLSSLACSSEPSTWHMMCILTASYYVLTIRS